MTMQIRIMRHAVQLLHRARSNGGYVTLPNAWDAQAGYCLVHYKRGYVSNPFGCSILVFQLYN